MRGALSLFAAWSFWLGGWLIRIFASLLLRSLENHKSEGQRSMEGIWTAIPTQGIGKRKRVQLREAGFPSYSSPLSNFSPVKRCMLVRLGGWRFWLPSSDLVGDDSLLSKSDNSTTSSDIPRRDADDLINWVAQQS
ncbi:unnamed protein product [Linum trigynum]|uniref:Uncharacterized protein n=1 Tax=Linum trigynum TaxID=586398 RepID=A0AAV2GB79_9ROSI